MRNSNVKPQNDKKVIMDAVRCGECGGVGYTPVKRISPMAGENGVGGWVACRKCNNVGRKVSG